MTDWRTQAGETKPRLIQLCFVVDDLETAMARFVSAYGAGPWFVGSGFPAEQDPTIYKGERVPLQTRIGLAYAGEIMFELACPMPGSRSIFSDWAVTAGFDTLHHYGFAVDDLDRAVAASEAAPVMTSRTPRGTRVAMFEDAELKAFREYIEVKPETRRFYEFMKAEADCWDRTALEFSGSIPDLG